MNHFPSRRQFLTASIVGATALAAQPSLAFGSSFRLRYILGSSLYGTLPLDQVVGEVRKTGADAIDIWPMKHANHREQMEEMGHEPFAALLKKHKVKLGVLSHYDLGPFGMLPEMPVAKKLGTRLLISNSRGPKGLQGDELKREVAKFVEQLKPHLTAAAKHDVIITIENHSGGLIASPDSIRWLFEMEKSPQLGFALAPYHLEQDPQMMARLIEDVGGRMKLFYAWQHGKGSVQKLPKDEELLQMPGRGALDFVPLVRALKKINFRGWTEIFMHPVPRGVPILDTLGEVTAEINRARAYLDACVKKA